MKYVKHEQKQLILIGVRGSLTGYFIPVRVGPWVWPIWIVVVIVVVVIVVVCCRRARVLEA